MSCLKLLLVLKNLTCLYETTEVVMKCHHSEQINSSAYFILIKRSLFSIDKMQRSHQQHGIKQTHMNLSTHTHTDTHHSDKDKQAFSHQLTNNFNQQATINTATV